MSHELDRTLEAMAGAARLVVLTGAGMSRDSGMPTFREAQTGLWAQYDPQQLATPQAFSRSPARVFGWYVWRYQKAISLEPHAGYDAVVRLEDLFDDVTVVTQNVDGLHSRAGSRRVVELHGSLRRFRCVSGGHPYAEERVRQVTLPQSGEVDPPQCPQCGSPVRPGVVWFGESLPPDAMREAWTAAEQCDAMLVVGTSALVYPAAGLPDAALANDRPVIEINPDPTPLSDRVDVWWSERAAVALPQLTARLSETP
jgi:NAD-dependent deacetylase